MPRLHVLVKIAPMGTLVSPQHNELKAAAAAVRHGATLAASFVSKQFCVKSGAVKLVWAKRMNSVHSKKSKC